MVEYVYLVAVSDQQDERNPVLVCDDPELAKELAERMGGVVEQMVFIRARESE